MVVSEIIRKGRTEAAAGESGELLLLVAAESVGRGHSETPSARRRLSAAEADVAAALGRAGDARAHEDLTGSGGGPADCFEGWRRRLGAEGRSRGRSRVYSKAVRGESSAVQVGCDERAGKNSSKVEETTRKTRERGAQRFRTRSAFWAGTGASWLMAVLLLLLERVPNVSGQCSSGMV